MPIEVLEYADPHAPYGLRGVGEAPTISSGPAVAAAIRPATGLAAAPGADPARAHHRHLTRRRRRRPEPGSAQGCDLRRRHHVVLPWCGCAAFPDPLACRR